MAHIWNPFFFLLCFFLDLIGSGGRDVITAFTGRLSCMEVMEHRFRGPFLSYDLNIHVQLISLVLFSGHQRLMPHGFCFFASCFPRYFRMGFSCLGSSPKKRGLFYHLSQRCVTYCMFTFDCRKRLAFVLLLPIIIGEIVMFFFSFSAIPDTTRSCNFSGTDLRDRATTCTLPDDS